MLTSPVPLRASDSGPQIPRGWIECENCGRYHEPAPTGPICSHVEIPGGARCNIRLCPNCEEEHRCYFCGRPVCLDHSRPHPKGKQRICSTCDYANAF